MNIKQSVQPEKKGPSLRADIDGLRAIAILVVVLYHAKFSDWSGGFVGVDVFFVISGYLIIPKIALDRLESRFVLSEFFAGRARRLIPALVPVLFVSFLLAFFLLGPDALESFSQSFLAAGTFVSNYVFLAQSGYFQRSAEDLLLLHTWSLAIEFQFYIITPLIFLLMDKRLNMKFVLMVLGAASLVVSIVLVGQGNDWAFYGIIPRFWELAFGGILGLISWNFPFPRYVGFLFRLLGIFAIIAAATQYTTAIPFPGIAAILPATGAALILVAPSNSKDPLFRFLSSTGMRWLGLRSYSIYLWHWPLIVSVHLAADKTSERAFVLAILFSFLIAELSYRYVEMPVRQKQFWRSQRNVLMLVVAPVLTIGSVWMFIQTPLAESARSVLPLLEYRVLDGLSDGERDEYMLTVHTSNLPEGRITRGTQCSFDETQSHTELLSCLKAPNLKAPVLVIGDSHGRDVFHALRTGFPSVDFVFLHQSSCSPADYPRTSKRPCFPGLLNLLERVLDEMNISSVVLASHWPLEGVDSVDETLSMLNAQNLNTVVIGPGPTFRVPVTTLLRSSGIGEEQNASDIRLDMQDFRFDIAKSDSSLALKAAAFDFTYVSKLNYFCKTETCLAFIPNMEWQLMFWDSQHLTISGIEWFGKILADIPQLQAEFLDNSKHERMKSN